MQFSIYKIYKAMVRSSVNYLNILFIFVLHVWEFTIMYVTALGACQAQECLKRDSDPLELDVHRLLNWYMGSENWTSFFFAKTAFALKYWVILLSSPWEILSVNMSRKSVMNVMVWPLTGIQENKHNYLGSNSVF